MKTFQILSFSFLLLILSVSCTTNSIEDFVVGENFIKDNSGIVMIDTLTLKSSIVNFDSIPSNSSGRFLVGSNYNSFSGYKNSKTFLEMKFDDAISQTKFVFDSLNLVLYFDTYYFGDTTVTQTFSVHQIREKMKLNNNSNLYTTSNFSYNDVPLGSISLKPRPRSHKKVSIRLSNSLGEQLAKMIMGSKDTITNEVMFTKFFNGLVIKSQSDVKGAVVGFRTTDLGTASSVSSSNIETKPEIRLYYHLSPNPGLLKDLYYKFSFYSDGINFNQISGNSSNSLIDGISDSRNERSTNLTNHQLFVQSGIQIYSKIQIPYVDNLLYMGKNSAFIGATLRLYPVKGTYRTADLPDSLYIYNGDRINQSTGQIYMPGSTTEKSFANLVVIRDVEELVYYDMDVSNFVNTELLQEFETFRSLMIGFGTSTAKKTAAHVVLGGQNSGKYSPKLFVYYYHN